jgi:hypothetical protein
MIHAPGFERVEQPPLVMKSPDDTGSSTVQLWKFKRKERITERTQASCSAIRCGYLVVFLRNCTTADTYRP